MISKFPEFTKISIELQEEIRSYTNKFEPYSDFNFTSLFSWDVDESTGVSDLNGNLVIKLPDYITGETIYSILGENEIDNSLKQLLEITKSLKLVPEVVVNKINHVYEFDIEEDRDQFDYVYSLQNMADLKGGKYKSKRKRINQFIREYVDTLNLKKINFSQESEKQEIKNQFSEWVASRNRDFADSENERKAIERLISNSNSFKLTGIKIYINEKCVGFSINELVQKDYSICHFQKSILTFEHIDLFFSNLVAKELRHFGSKYINWEQDLGIPGLRELKQNYLQDFFLKKYILKKKT